MKILITGGAGVLGSSLASMLYKNGYEVSVLDIIRPEEAWRLSNLIRDIKYIWKAQEDMNIKELENFDIVIDCAIGSADRPFGITSPIKTVLSNTLPPLYLLEKVRNIYEKLRPIIIYPSSFNALYGYGNIPYSEKLLPNPVSIYGWTKGSVEQLYMVYYKSFGVPVIITRTSSAYGPMGRSDELPHKLIIYSLTGKARFYLRSPRAKRLWTYMKDILDFYHKLINKISDEPEEVVGRILHVAGNADNKIIENIELAKIIKRLTKSSMNIIEANYEPGEIVNGKPISFTINTIQTQKMINWKPKYTLEKGLKETIEWFKKNLWRYQSI